MRIRCLMTALAASLCALPASAADTYAIDPDHSFPFFEVGHAGFSLFRGRFGKMQGKVSLDQAAKAGAIDVEIDATSIDTGLARRDAELKNERWFNTAKYPTLTYKSNAIRFDGDKVVAADGELTIAGVTKPVTLTVENFRCGASPFNPNLQMCGASANATIKRSDFGLKASLNSVADEVKILVSLEARKEQ